MSHSILRDRAPKSYAPILHYPEDELLACPLCNGVITCTPDGKLQGCETCTWQVYLDSPEARRFYHAFLGFTSELATKLYRRCFNDAPEPGACPACGSFVTFDYETGVIGCRTCNWSATFNAEQTIEYADTVFAIAEPQPSLIVDAMALTPTATS